MIYIKKNIGIASAVVVGVLTIGGTAYGYTQHQHTEHLAAAKIEIKSERVTLNHLNQQITSLSPDQDGFLPKELTQSKLNHIQKSLEQLKDSYTDFDIHKNDLKSEIKVVALSKGKVEHDLNQIESKFKAQQTVNALFEQPVIDGNKVSAEPVKEGVLLSKVKQVSTKVIGNRTTGDAWFKAINASVKDAESQVKQITLAKSKVNALIKNGKVVKGVSKKAYDAANKEVNKVKTASIKKSLKSDLDRVFKVVKANEKKADALAKKKAQDKAKKSGGKVVKTKDGSYKVEKPSTVSSNSGSSGSSTSSSPSTTHSTGSSTSSYSGSSHSSSGSSTVSSGSSHTTTTTHSSSTGSSSSGSSTPSSAPKTSQPSGGSSTQSSGGSSSSGNSSQPSGGTEVSHSGGSIPDSVEGGKDSTWDGGALIFNK